MQVQEVSVPCEGLLFRMFHQLGEHKAGSTVAITSPVGGAGVSRITSALVEAFRRDGNERAVAVSASELTSRESETATKTKLFGALESLRREYQHVLIDCGSIKDTQHAVRLAPLVDGIILVVEANRTQTSQIRYAERTLESVNGRILGHVLNKRTYVVPDWCYRMMNAIGA